jgi:[acyl-carrier-protein] S-malonyltransferase
MNRAVVFAGQGAQAVGMGKDLAQAFPECKALFDRANAALGFDLAKLCFEGPLEELTKSDNCQPAIFVVSAACHAALQKRVPGMEPAGMAGLSLGEWTALYAAGALGFEDAVRVLRARGRFMQAACEQQQGGMVSVMGLSLVELEKVSAAAGVQIANLNAPDQTVLSGEKARIAEAEKLAQAAGAKRTVVLNVAGAFHSRLMDPAAAQLKQFLAGVTFRAPAVPVVANVTGLPHGGPDAIRDAMVNQVTSPVRWVADIEWLQKAGVREYVECGPGKVLSGLIKRIDKDSAAHSIQDCSSLEKAAAALSGQPAA